MILLPRHIRPAASDPRWAALGRRARLMAYALPVLQEGRGQRPPLTARHPSMELGVQLICTREAGMHACGWWKNPEYDRCLHASIAFRDPETGDFEPFRFPQAEAIAAGAFGSHLANCWTEPPSSASGRAAGVHHFRVFYDPDWRTPVRPRGEVYDRQWTPAGWQSWSERLATEAAAAEMRLP